MSTKIERIEISFHQLGLDPPFLPAWDTQARKKFPATIVRIYDGDGRMGIGSGDAMYGFEDFKYLFIGQQADQLERHNSILHNIGFHAGRCFPLEIAIWDLVGLQRGTPCWKMAGGGRNCLTVYASSGVHRGPEESLEQIRYYLEKGFTAAKLRFGRPNLEDDLKVIKYVAKSIGDKIKIMVDCNQGWRMPWDINSPWDLNTALKVARVLEEYGVYWMEEPLHRGAVEDMAALRRPLKSLLIAGAELTREPYEFERLLENDCLDIYQPDVAVTMGMHSLVSLASKVTAKNKIFSPHTWGNGIGLMANAHITAGVNKPDTELYLEFPHDPPEWTSERRDFFLTEPIVVDNKGQMHLSEAPGLGLKLNEDILKKTRSNGQNYI
jgi:L-alanine-DL-glutamate epimerase-like enolase superfamily enzyme